MNSKILILLTLLLIIAVAGQASAATITATPSNVPKGAYVNGPGGATDDNYFFQTVTLEADFGHIAGGFVYIYLPTGMYIADLDSDSDWEDEVSVTADAAIAPTVNTTIGETIATRIRIDHGNAITAGDIITVMFPVITDSGPTDDDYWVDFSTTPVADDISNGSGFTVTYVDPAPNAIALVSFTAYLSANDDSTNAKGDKYPTTAVPTYGALPDLIVDSADLEIADNVTLLLLPYALSGGEGGDETTYQVWVSRDSTLAHVDSLTAGVFHAVKYTNLSKYIQDEGETGSVRYALGGYPEGDYYFYITSPLTGDFPLARSGKLYVRHWPVINAVGWDYDHDGYYVPGAPGAGDDKSVYLDSGRYYNYAGTPSTNDHFTFLDIYSHVDDLDDNAKIHLFYSSAADLDTSDVETSGSSADSSLAVTDLKDGTLIAADLLENSEDAQGFIRYRWSMDPVTTGVHPGANLTVYCITCDGKHIDISPVKGVKSASLPVIESGTTSLLTYIKNSPRLKLDVLTEYDSTVPPAGAIDINVQDHDQIMISWAKSGVGGDVDVDDSAKIELYINNETDNGRKNWALTECDYGHDMAAELRQDAVDDPTNVHKIAEGLLEDLDSKGDSWYAWDLKSDSWNPTETKAYIIYAIIDDQVPDPDNTSIVTTILPSTNTFFIQGADLTSYAIQFTNSEFARLVDPPAEGVTINAEETYRMRFSAFDWDEDKNIGIFIWDTTNGPVTATIDDLDDAAENAYCLTSINGTAAGGATEWLSDDTDTYYDVQIAVPGSPTVYTLQMNGNAPPIADGSYWVYIGIDNNNDNFVEGTETLYRAPGELTIVNAAQTPVQKNLTVSPIAVTVANGDTVDFSIKGVIPAAGTVDRIDLYIAVEKQWWDVASPSAPFTAATAFAGGLLTNTVIDDTVGNRWILRTVVFGAGATTQFDTLPISGLGNNVVTFQLVSKGTSDALPHETRVYFVDETANNRVTMLSNNGSPVSITTLSSTVSVGPRAIIKGIVELQGRTKMNTEMTFELRERGGYDNVSDALLYSTNDADETADGIQFTPDTDGFFMLLKVPSGEYDLAVIYNRYLSKVIQVDVYPGIDTLSVAFNKPSPLKGGDCTGYTDELGHAYPNNKIDIGDLNKMQSAFLADSTYSEWNDGTNNWKWADINEDDIVEVDDLSMATGNQDESGDQPVFDKPAAGEEQNNGVPFVEFMNVPSQLKAGETYTIQVVGHDITDARAYFVNMNYDREALAFAGIVKGDFIKSDSYSFPVVGEGSVGLANSVFGESVFSGAGVLAEVMFTANYDGAFTADMLGFERASIVNADYFSENIIVESITNVDSGDIPVAFALGQNFPNPFNPTTAIEFSVPENGFVSIKIFDVLGRHVRTLVSRDYSAGNYSVMWDATDMSGNLVSNGIYFYTIEAGNFRATKRMLFLK